VAPAALLWLAFAGCKSDDSANREEQRRQLLRGQDLDKQRNEQIDKTRLTDEHGDLLPSETKVAGLVLPRGFNPKFTLDYEWYYDGALPLDKLEKYFRKQFDSASIKRPDDSSVEFLRPTTKDLLGAALTIYPVPGRADWSRIHVQGSRPQPEHPLSAEEIQAELARRAAIIR
jgi:hypothetical protein